MKEIDIVFRDEALLVLNKPPGLLAVPGVGPDKQDCLSGRVQAEYPEATVVHRLDRDTSGLMVMARNPEVHRALGALFERRKMEKAYRAVVFGRVAEDAGTIDLPIHRDWEQHDPPMYKIDHERGRPSITHWQVLQREQDRTALVLHPETGRSHQLRLHLLTLGHPILGDNIYAPAEAKAMAERLMLHAHTLGFVHPVSGAAMAFERPVPW